MMMLMTLQKKLLLAATVIVWIKEANGLDVPEKGILLKYGKRDENFDNKIGKSASFKTNHGWSLPYCAVMCQRDGSCVSFFYNKKTKECQGQGTNIEDHTHVHEYPGTKYYKMYQRKNIRNTSKLIEKFNNFGFTLPEKELRDIYDVKICLKKCQDEFLKCVTVNYISISAKCNLFEVMHTKPTDGYQSEGAVYYRVAKTFCAEDEDYFYFSDGKICLKYFSQNVSWNEADLACKAEEAHLADVETKKMKGALEMYMKVQNKNYYSTAHVGIKDEDNDGVYVGRNYKPIDGSLWKRPFLDYPGKNCINIRCRFSCGWNIVDCDSFLSGFICEK